MLRYLEDLQRDNPAEYDLLVQQLNEKRGVKGDAPQGGMKVMPKAGFVAKTRSATQKGQKIFINICQADEVDPPEQMEGADDELPLRIPLSLGPPREDLDREGNVCGVYDVVFHPKTVASALDDPDFRQLMLQLTLHQIKQKYDDELSHELTFPKVKGNYKGLAPLPQYMRKREAKPAADAAEEAAGSAGASASTGGGGPAIEEVGWQAEVPEALPTPAYAVEPRRAADAPADGPADSLSVKLHLPAVASSSEVEVRISADELTVHAPGKYHAAVMLPHRVGPTPLYARFETSRRVLSIALRSEAEGGGGLDDTAAEKGAAESGARGRGAGRAAGEAARREREAALRAKRRAAAAAQRRGGGDSGSDGGPQIEEIPPPAEGHLAGGGAAPTGGDGEGGAAEGNGAEAVDGAGASADAPPPPPAAKERGSGEDGIGPLELTSSFLYELEED